MTLMPNIKTLQEKKQNYVSISLMNIYLKILNKILGSQIQQYIKMTIPHNQMEFIPGIQEGLPIGKSVKFTSINILKK